MFWNFEVALNVTKKLSTSNLLHESFFAERTSKGKICSKMIFYCCISSIYFLSLELPHFNNFVSFLLDIFFAHLVLLSLFHPPDNFVVSQWRASFLTWTVVIVTSHSFKKCVTRITNNTEAINILLSTSCNTAFKVTIRTSLLKMREDHFFERACFFWRGMNFRDSVS